MTRPKCFVCGKRYTRIVGHITLDPGHARMLLERFGQVCVCSLDTKKFEYPKVPRVDKPRMMSNP